MHESHQPAVGEDPDKFDHSDHPTGGAKRGDLNPPGQVDEEGGPDMPHTEERPGVIPKHRG